MLRKNDFIIVSFGLLGIGLGLMWPGMSRIISPHIAYAMMLLLFFSFLKISPADVQRPLKDNPGRLSLLAAIKLILMPLAAYFLTRWIAPEYTLAMILLAGASTGVTAPFFIGVTGGNAALVLVLALFTSFIMPLSLPLMVRLTAGQSIQFDLVATAGFLAVIIFTPLIAAAVLKRFAPGCRRVLERVSFPVSAVLILGVNTGMFGKYAGFIVDRPEEFIMALLAASALAGLALAVGAAVLRGAPPRDRAAAAGTLCLINNVLIIVLGTHLDDALTSITAALYMLPTMLVLIPLARLARMKKTA